MTKTSENEFEILKLGNPILRLTAKELTKEEILSSEIFLNSRGQTKFLKLRDRPDNKSSKKYEILRLLQKFGCFLSVSSTV